MIEPVASSSNRTSMSCSINYAFDLGTKTLASISAIADGEHRLIVVINGSMMRKIEHVHGTKIVRVDSSVAVRTTNIVHCKCLSGTSNHQNQHKFSLEILAWNRGKYE